MARRIDWERRRFDQRLKLSLKDEEEFRGRDLAARWLERKEQRLNLRKRGDIPKTKRPRWKHKARTAAGNSYLEAPRMDREGS